MNIKNYLKQTKQSFPQKGKILQTVFLITHKNCLDGSACAVVLSTIFKNLKIFFTHQNSVSFIFNKINEKVEKEDLVILADVCCDQNFFLKMSRLLKEKQVFIKVYEHHESTKWLEKMNMKKNPGDVEILYDKARSASKILFDHFLSSYRNLEKYKDFIELVNDRDLWLGKNPLAVSLAHLHQIYGDKAFVNRFLKNPFLDFTDKETILLEYQKKKEAKKNNILLSRMIFKTNEEGFKYGLVYGEGSGSDLLNEAIKRFGLEYAILVNLNMQRVSLRSKGNFDCAQFSSRYGGGGHKRASGFLLNDFKPPVF